MKQFQYPNQIASAFLSHSKKCKVSLVREIADLLGHFGIIPWIDEEELVAGEENVETYILKEIQEQSAFIIFLSKISLQDSIWVEEELKHALKLENNGKNHSVIPVFLEDPMELVYKSSLLKSSGWLSEDHRKILRMGIPAENLESDNIAYDIADNIAKRVYKILDLENTSEINLIFDQRGQAGKRTGMNGISNYIEVLSNRPTLVYRDNRKERSKQDFLSGNNWIKYTQRLKKNLPYSTTERKVYLLGKFQHALGFFLGTCYDRTNIDTSLYCYNYFNKNFFTNQGQRRTGILDKGDKNKLTIEVLDEPSLIKDSEIALYVGKENYFEQVKKDVTQKSISILGSIIEDEDITTSEKALTIIEDVVTAICQIRKDYNVDEIRFYTSLPVALMPLLGANLTKHVIPKIKFIDFDHHSNTYVYIPFE